MMTPAPWRPDWRVHPGEILLDELRERQMRQVTLARLTGLSTKHINQIIKGHVGITPEVALRLEVALGASAETWCNLQQAYDLHLLRSRRFD